MFISVALIHPSAKAVPMLTEVAHDVIADVELIHMVDEGVQRMMTEAGGMTEPVTRRICSCAMNAQEAGAEVVMLASPRLGAAVDAVCSSVRIPVVRIDEAMADAAVQLGNAVGVLSADETVLEASLALLRERAVAHEKDVDLDTALCDEARQALESNDLAAYDRAVMAGVDQLAGNDMVVLADVMMHRVVHTAAEQASVPVLASPRHGFEDMAKRLNYFRR